MKQKELKEWAVFRMKDTIRLSEKGYKTYWAISREHAIELFLGDYLPHAALKEDISLFKKDKKSLDGPMYQLIFYKGTDIQCEYWVAKPKIEVEKDIDAERTKTKTVRLGNNRPGWEP